MEVGKLKAQFRRDAGKGTSRRLRAEGLVPATCYGAGLESPVSLTLSPKALQAALDPQRRRNTVIDLEIEDDGVVKHSVKAMVWEFQVHPLRQEVSHVDLKAIDTELPVEAEVPIVAEGKHAGAIDGGLLSWDRHRVTIRCKPGLIPPSLVLDIRPLKLGEALHISDLPLPEGIEFVDSTKLTIVTCVAPKGAEKKAAGAAEEESAEAKK